MPENTPLPIVRSTKDFFRDPLGFTVRQVREVGDFYRLRFYFRRLYVTTNLEVIRHVLQVNHRNYVKSPAYRELKQALGNGLVTSEGELWRRQRRLMQPIFYKQALQGIFEKMRGCAEAYCQSLEQRPDPKRPLDISEEMMGITADIVLKTLFSSDNPASRSELFRSMWVAQDYIMWRTLNPLLTPLVWVNGMRRRFRKALRLFDQNIYRLIEEREKAENPPHDLLSLLVHARDEETGEGMSRRQLRDEAITMYSAGHETSSNGLTWTLYLLSQHPHVLAELRAEVDAVLGDRTPGFEDLKALDFTHMVLEESMRLYPPAYAVGREAVEEDLILGQRIPPKSILLISIFALHRDPRHWEDPEAFRPERFAAERIKERPRLAYMPFGAGPRMCIGNHFAMMEMQLLLAMLIRRFDFELVEGHPVEPEPLITLKPKHGLLMRVLPRRRRSAGKPPAEVTREKN